MKGSTKLLLKGMGSVLQGMSGTQLRRVIRSYDVMQCIGLKVKVDESNASASTVMYVYH